MPKTDQARIKRGNQIIEYLRENPFATDENLAKHFGVSINTIRLDRNRLGIKQLRDRIKIKASQNLDKITSLSKKEIIGDIIEFAPAKSAVSAIETKEYMLFENTNIVKGYHIYSIAESLAISIIPSKVALVGVASIKFVKKILNSEMLYATAEVKKKRDTNYIVGVEIKNDNEELKFKGKFLLKEIV